MNRIVNAVTASVFATALCVGAFAQDHRDDHKDDGHGNQGQAQRGDYNRGGPGQQHNNNQYVRHNDWHKGSRLAPNDWNRGDRIDYRQYHLAPPRQGYEWRRVDGNYVMAAVATGLVASLIVASTMH